jgi:hypothetical protein
MTFTNAINCTVTGVITGVGNGTFTASALTNHDVLVGAASNAITSVTPGTSGYVLTSNGVSADPSFQAPAAAGTAWASTTVNASITTGSGYIADKAGLLTMTLPASPTLGHFFEIINNNTAVGWRIAQNAGQQMRIGTSTTTVGVGGYLEATQLGDAIRMICTVGGASAVWTVCPGTQGNITVV